MLSYRILSKYLGFPRIWGVGLAQDDPLIRDPRNWRGENLLGFVLMEARDGLRTEEAYSDARR